MQTPDTKTYPAPVDALLTIGDNGDRRPEAWPDYAAEYHLALEHEADLIAMAGDMALHWGDGKSDQVWAPMHAWRALGQLRSHAAIEPLVALLEELEDDDYADAEIPTVLGMIGPASLPAVARVVHDPAGSPHQVNSLLAALAAIGEHHPEARADCIAHLARTLADLDPAHKFRNGHAVSALIDLRATEEIALIREAFAHDVVDISMSGDVEDVEIELGLREHRDTPKPNYLQAYFPRAGSQADEEDEGFQDYAPVQQPIRVEKTGRNEPCPCGSGKKYKKCCLGKAAS